MNKVSAAQAGQMMKVAGATILALSNENHELRMENEGFRKKAHAERIAKAMQDKGIDPETTYEEKVAGIVEREDLHVLEQAVGMSAPQMKIASVHEDNRVLVDGDSVDNQAAEQFAANLASF